MKRLAVFAVIIVAVLFVTAIVPCLAQQTYPLTEKDKLRQQLRDCRWIYNFTFLLNVLTSKYIQDTITDTNDPAKIIKLLHLKDDLGGVKNLLLSQKEKLDVLRTRNDCSKKELDETLENILSILDKNYNICGEVGNMEDKEETKKFLKNGEESIQAFRDKYK